MVESADQKQRRAWWRSTLISSILASLTQLALFTVVLVCPDSSMPSLLPLSAVALLVVIASGRCCKRRLRVRASAPAFVFFSIIFIWGVYIGVVRQVISLLMDIAVNSELLMLFIGLCCIMSVDPGHIKNDSSHLNELLESQALASEGPSEESVPSSWDMPYELAAQEISVPLQRIRYCRQCKAYVKGFDHHCPAFGNCIGQKNHVLFITLLFGFVVTEASYIACSSQFTTKTQTLDKTGEQASLSRNLAVSTMLFSLLQMLWQVVFLAWHIYCICFNIRTDEWIHWNRYPEFHLNVQPEPGQTSSATETRFINPYDKGIFLNVKEFLTAKG
ncbi:uncharacterized protein LOC127797259 [Diospyros lotus]|uniref:uncharacterized protein LOC127797259 n=1 Tax=Diospyros lotus TaxID=55363 RepID=UPI0022537985|nr:uncharacterized protein LOC127797259 [Diospyros lotus]